MPVELAKWSHWLSAFFSRHLYRGLEICFQGLSTTDTSTHKKPRYLQLDRTSFTEVRLTEIAEIATVSAVLR